MSRLAPYVCLALLFCAAVYAQEATAVAQSAEYSARLQSLEQESKIQMQALEEQRTLASPQDAEVIEKRVADLKFQHEIRRLTILLEQAEAGGDEARAAEIQRALNNWLNPSAPEITAPVQRSAPGTPDASPEVRESTR